MFRQFLDNCNSAIRNMWGYKVSKELIFSEENSECLNFFLVNIKKFFNDLIQHLISMTV